MADGVRKLCVKNMIFSSRNLLSFSLLFLFNVYFNRAELNRNEAESKLKTEDNTFLPKVQLNQRGLNFMIIFVENINYLQHILDSKEKEGKNVPDLPNIRKFAKESFLFENAYSELHSASSSATLLTGLPATETGMIKGKILPFNEIPSVASTGGLQYEHATLAESIKHITQQGDEIPKYLTAFVGYWKLGHGQSGMYLPHHRGFDFWTGVAFPHSNSCTGRKKYLKTSWRSRRVGYHYVDLIYDILPWLVGILIGTCSAYYFKVISSKGFFHSLLYFFLATFIFFAFLEIYRVQKSATCLLYHMNEITEQPYHMENLTLFFTTNVLAMLDYFSEKSQPFFLNLNYLKLREPHFASKYFKTNQSQDDVFESLQELDWSIGKIMAKFDELELADKTLIILTGNNHCKKESNGYDDFYGYERKEKNVFNPISVSDLAEKCMKVPLYLKHGQLKMEKRRTSLPISFLDLTPTILELLTNTTQDDFPGCNIIPVITAGQNDGYLPKIYDLKQEGIMDESVHNKHRCNPLNRMHFHYVDVRRTCSVTIGSSFRVVFLTSDESGTTKKLKHPIIRSLRNNLNIQNISTDYLEELYQNLSTVVERHKQQRKNKWSSQFEMPVYPWIIPCANFPKCEAFNHMLSDFSFLEPINAGLITPRKEKDEEIEPLATE